MTTTAKDWLERYARRLGVESPDDDSIELLLSMAAIAAHASERTAAPISAWLIGRSGLDPAEALAAAGDVAAELAAEDVAEGAGPGRGDLDGGDDGSSP